MKHTFTRIALATAVTLCALSAQATNNTPQPQPAEANALGVGVGIGVGVGMGGAGGAGGHGGAGGNATAIQGQQQGQIQAQALRNTIAVANTAAGGLGGSSVVSGIGGGAGGTVGNVTGGNLDMAGASIGGVTVERSAPPAYAPDGKAPRTSCRLFIGFGGSGPSAALSGGIPIGNDQTCVSGAQMEAMDKVNKVAPGTFAGPDYLRAACAMEGMAATAGCKKAAEQERAQAALGN